MMQNVERRKWNIVKDIFFFLFLSAPFFQVGYLMDTISWVPKAYTLWQVVAGAIISVYFVKDKVVKKLLNIYLPIAGILITMCIASGINEGSLKRALQYSFGTVVICLVVQYGIEKNIRRFLEAEMILFGSLTYFNFLSILAYPKGLYSYLDYYVDSWFLGFKSGHIPYQLAFLFFMLIYREICVEKEDRFSFSKILWFSLILIYASNVLVKNRTAMVVLLPVTVVAIFPRILRFTKLFNIWLYAAAGIFMNLLFVVFRGQELFRWLIVGVFHRSMTLTKRVFVWDLAMQQIQDHPVIGHGYNTFVYTREIVTTHNEILEILYKTGFIGLLFYLALLVLVVVALYKNRKNIATGYIAGFLGVYFLMFVMEQHAFANFFYILIFGMYAGRLEEIFARQKESAKEAEGTGEQASAETKSRMQNSYRNFFFTMAANVTAIFIGLVAQKLFLALFGLEYAGLNGLFSNVIAMLGIVDLGIGEAVVFHLYKPLQENDREKVKTLIRFYRKAFHIVAAVIALIGLGLIPVLPYIAKTENHTVNLTVIYLIYLADVVLSYVLSYKRSILYADQKNFYISKVHMWYLIGMNTSQLVFLYVTRNYYVYLLVKIFFRVLENVVITMIANKLYPFLKEKNTKPMDEETGKDIRKKVGALFFHKIGGFAVNGTDNILISVFFGLGAVGLYNNYFMVIDAATKLFGPAVASLTPSVGNLLVSGNDEAAFRTFRKIRFLNFWIAAFAGTAMLVLFQPFIEFWFGKEYLLSFPVAIVLSFQFFQNLMRGSYSAFQDAAGIFYENRFVPLVESIVNLLSSIILLKLFGLPGVFAGTIVSSLCLWGFSYPKFVYKKLFHRGVGKYALEMLGYLAVFFIVCTVSFLIGNGIRSSFANPGFGVLVLEVLVSLFVPNLLMMVIFLRHDVFRYFVGVVKEKLL